MFKAVIETHIQNILQFDSIFKKEESEGNIKRKSSKKSTEVRQAGNRIFLSKHINGDENHKKILALYSESIALAPKDSEELATAYGNRSALFKHLNFKEKCLIDIDRALRITKSDNLKIKLLARKTECLKLKDEVDTSEKDSNLNNDNTGSDKQFKLVPATTQNLKFPSFIPSKEIPCAAESIAIAYTKSLGRHMVATRDIQPGEVIIVEEGYAVFPKINAMYLICSNCLTIAWNGVPCDHCVFAFYCSEECKEKSWKEYHDVECLILPYLFNKCIKNADPTMIIMTARFFIRAVKSEGLENVLIDSRTIDDVDGLEIEGLLSNGIYDNKKFKFCYNLLSHQEYYQKKNSLQDFYVSMLTYLLFRHSSLLNKYGTVANGHLSIAGSKEILELHITLVKIMNILTTNWHTFQGSPCDCNYISQCDEKCTGKRGSVFASCSSLINHSCHPNISRMFMPERKIVIFTTCPVKKGEQLCDTYGPTVRYKSKIERQEYLMMLYHFICNCQACEENWSIKLNKSVLKDFKKLNTKWYVHRYLKPYQDWPYNENTLRDVIEATELAYKSFDRNKAYALSIPCRDYLETAFYKFYGDDNYILDKCF